MSNNANKYHLGLTGWNTKEWAGSFYRRKSKANDYLSQYSTVFNTVEGNTTFYSIPRVGDAYYTWVCIIYGKIWYSLCQTMHGPT